MITAALLPFLSIGPGSLLVRPLHLRPADRPVVAILVGLFAQAAAVFSAFVMFGGPAAPAVSLQKAYVGIAVISGILTCLCLPSLFRSSEHSGVKSLLQTYAGFAAVSVGLLLSLRNFSGGTWVIDWHVHYSQSCYYLGFLTTDNYLADFPSRPPMQNLLTALGMAVWPQDNSSTAITLAPDFASFQLASILLATVAFLPCVRLATRFSARLSGQGTQVSRRRLPLLTAAALLATPAVVAHLLFPWPKLLAAAYVLMACHLYLRHLDEPEPLAAMSTHHAKPAYLVTAVILLSIGCLVHYSCAVYGLVLLGHVMWRALRGRARWSSVVTTITIPALFLAPWFGWSIQTFGLQSTLTSPSSINESRGFTPAQHVEKLLANTLHTFIPHPVIVSRSTFDNGRPDSGGIDAFGFAQPSPLGYLRDYTFTIFTSTIPWSCGTPAGALLIVLACSNVLKRRSHLPANPNTSGNFWRWLVIGVIPIGIAVVGGFSLFGVAQLTMVPLTLVGLTLAFTRLPSLPTWARRLYLAGLVLDLLLAIWPHLIASNHVFPLDAASKVIVLPDTLSRRAAGQYQWMTSLHLTTLAGQFGVARAALPLALLIPLGAVAFLAMPHGRRRQPLRP